MKPFRSAIYYLIICFICQTDAYAQVTLPHIFRDSMILQRDAKIRIWGRASPGEKVRVSIAGRRAWGFSSPSGNWDVLLPAIKAGGPYRLTVRGEKNNVVLRDVLLGDLWLCSGQSNMVHQLGLHSTSYSEEIEEASFPEIRQFWVPTSTDLNGRSSDTKRSYWKSANSRDVRDFSAVAYFFAKDIYKRHRIPIGIINASVGGTPIKAWTSSEGLQAFPDLQETIMRNRDSRYLREMDSLTRIDQEPRATGPDKGQNDTLPWYDPEYHVKLWKDFYVPGYWEDQGVRGLDGVVWFRKEFNIPPEAAGGAAELMLGRIVDSDVAYINGQQVGKTSYQYPQRRYSVPAGLLKPGKNLLVVRIQNNNGKGGFVPDKPYRIKMGDRELDLVGAWQYRVGQVFVRDYRGKVPPFSRQDQPSALFNAMIAPFTKMAIKGVLWYQGEADWQEAANYGKMLPALIKDWRKQFGKYSMPFYYVQLPNFSDATYLPGESSWAELREAALKTLKLPWTGMAVTIDLGEWNDIHPDDKRNVGLRLARIARRFDYGETGLVYSGPIYRSQEIRRSKIIISFDHVGGGLISIDGEPLSQFAVAGADRKFVWAQARIVNNQVEVWSEDIQEPLYVRYAWADNPVDPNLYNSEGLPASPFSTIPDKED